jgi:hypothetical protein
MRPDHEISLFQYSCSTHRKKLPGKACKRGMYHVTTWEIMSLPLTKPGIFEHLPSDDETHFGEMRGRFALTPVRTDMKTAVPGVKKTSSKHPARVKCTDQPIVCLNFLGIKKVEVISRQQEAPQRCV